MSLRIITNPENFRANIRKKIDEKLNNEELNHEKWAQLIDAKSKRDKNRFESNMAASTDTFTCRKCKGNKCTYYLMQTKSADEPMTCFIQCVLCNNRWRTS